LPVRPAHFAQLTRELNVLSKEEMKNKCGVRKPGDKKMQSDIVKDPKVAGRRKRDVVRKPDKPRERRRDAGHMLKKKEIRQDLTSKVSV
jgi:hypothetical protein